MSHPDPICVHPLVAVSDRDHGRDPETGYRDAGCAVTCPNCGEQFTEAEFRQELTEQERDRNPQPGDVYRQFESRLVIVNAGGDDVFYVCKNGNDIGPLRSVPLPRFEFFLSRGVITRERGAIQ